MSNNIVDLTDQFNDILSEYDVGDHAVDLDAWSTWDLMDVLQLMEQALLLRGEELPVRPDTSDAEKEYDDAMLPTY